MVTHAGSLCSTCRDTNPVHRRPLGNDIFYVLPLDQEHTSKRARPVEVSRLLLRGVFVSWPTIDGTFLPPFLVSVSMRRPCRTFRRRWPREGIALRGSLPT